VNEKEKKDLDENDPELGGQSDPETDHEKGESDKDRQAPPEPLENSRWFTKV